MEEFKELKITFFAEVNSFKNQILTSQEILLSTSQNSETTEMIQLHEDILFLKEQIRNKDKSLTRYYGNFQKGMIFFCYKIEGQLQQKLWHYQLKI